MKRPPHPSDRRLWRAAAGAYRAALDAPDPALDARLAAARRAALARRRPALRARLRPAFGWAAAALLLALAWRLMPPPGPWPAGGEAAEWLLAGEEPALLLELDFYLWLAEQDLDAG
ncbi:MAG: hypothetical protein KatS3mg121_0811 [Gammaproteobacteria bacterium]|nr:MAG: hypothetical protein KatS3mg121_0811 [Gammaproteobacteria bacterium]